MKKPLKHAVEFEDRMKSVYEVLSKSVKETSKRLKRAAEIISGLYNSLTPHEKHALMLGRNKSKRRHRAIERARKMVR